ncbi:hypothetical protein niasHT_010234 [Heterodera trifolii]|uniref:Amiloride-sensitive sodium channel n=1 Tax=Heterodera trifolii TaxID=157864 RepID=A0ABD2LR11_9BILA
MAHADLYWRIYKTLQHGLRLLVHINTSDYLPTTQSAGVRIAIHSQDEHPFPDAFGYSAPTNMLSSFGIGLRKVTRLPIPEGECLMPDHPLPSWYIYKDYKYEPEGCYKSCYQNQIILRCGCADPRYPSPNNYTKVCNSLDALSRNCLLVESTKFTRAQQCSCKHPCKHDLYTPTFSSARLTPEAFKKSTSCSSAKGICNGFNAESAVLLEIYYEQMSHEVLTESESYMLVNFVSDVGGQAGLWLGASILTLFEVVVFVLRILTIFCRRRFRRDVTVGDSSSGQESSEIVHKKGPSVVESRRSKTLSQRLKKAAKQRLRKVSSIPSVGAVTVGSPPTMKNMRKASKLCHNSTTEFFIGSATDLACQKNGIDIVKEEEEENHDDGDDGNFYVTLS